MGLGLINTRYRMISLVDILSSLQVEVIRLSKLHTHCLIALRSLLAAVKVFGHLPLTISDWIECCSLINCLIVEEPGVVFGAFGWTSTMGDHAVCCSPPLTRLLVATQLLHLVMLLHLLVQFVEHGVSVIRHIRVELLQIAKGWLQVIEALRHPVLSLNRCFRVLGCRKKPMAHESLLELMQESLRLDLRD